MLLRTPAAGTSACMADVRQGSEFFCGRAGADLAAAGRSGEGQAAGDPVGSSTAGSRPPVTAGTPRPTALGGAG